MALTVPPHKLSGTEKRMIFDFADGPLAFLTVRIGLIAKRQIVERDLRDSLVDETDKVRAACGR